MKRSATILISAASGFVLLAAGTAAGAAIAGPIDGNGVIHACHANPTGNGQHAIVLENAGTPLPGRDDRDQLEPVRPGRSCGTARAERRPRRPGPGGPRRPGRGER